MRYERAASNAIQTVRSFINYPEYATLLKQTQTNNIQSIQLTTRVDFPANAFTTNTKTQVKAVQSYNICNKENVTSVVVKTPGTLSIKHPDLF